MFPEVEKVLKSYDPSISPIEMRTLKEELERSRLDLQKRPYAEAIFRYLAGAGGATVDSIDYSDYEKATIVHDMCKPIPEHLKSKYSFVVDGGTLEHVFDYPTAIKNCMEMVKPGGHLLLGTPANNFFGHGFYQFSPELFYSLLNERNGYSDTQIFIQDDHSKWYRIASPQNIQERVNVCIARREDILMYVLSRRLGEVPGRLTVLQSDYVTKWNDAEVEKIPSLPRRLYRKLPFRFRTRYLAPVLRRFLNRSKVRKFYEPYGEILSCRKREK
jgi:SAM-dependent methyltransferase